MAKPKNGSKQKLSPKAAKDKAVRDLKIANTPARKKKRNECQKKRRAAIKAGKNIKGKDYDHKTKRFVSVKKNRSGTKLEDKNKK
mgnify:CR=1 FL=1|tara:strand:- start:47306 stop:47560 length:255 start_codon:yes stop_codon:yes gene_type:complete